MKLPTQQFLILLPLASLVAAMNMDMDMDMETDSKASTDVSSDNTDNSTLEAVPHEMMHMHGVPILETDLTPAEHLFWDNYNTTTFFTIDAPHKSSLWFHAATIVIAFVVLYPMALMFNSVKSKWYIPALTLYNITLIASLIALQVYASTAPLLYPGQVYGKMSWILLFASLTQYAVAILHCASQWISGEWFLPLEDEREFIPLEDLDLERGDSPSPSHSTLIDENRSSGDITPTNHEETTAYKDSLDLGDHDLFTPKGQSSSQVARDGILARVFTHPRVQRTAEKFSPIIGFVFRCMNIPMFGYLFVYVMVGICVGNLMGQGNKVFNLLAHFIKGGVFVSLGLFSLARYCGALSQSGLAWNKCVVFKNQVDPNSFWYRWTPHGMFTMEFYESFLIFFYGSTNIFLEHLASPGGAWDAKDLQHVSIAFMYIGSGLCGLITEKMLSDWRFNQVLSNTKINPSAIVAGSPGFSPNPFPVFTIFWTGILMSQHKQSSEISTNIHMQWGYLLSYGSFFRLLTFLLLMLQPNKNLAPSRPFTELITSFCLIAGGAIFMQSTDQVVQAMEWRGLTEMFTLNVNVGIVTLLMAWEMVLLIWKDKLQRK